MSLTKTAKISEANVSKAIQDLLSAKKILWFRMNSSAQLLSYTNKAGQTKRRMLRGHKPGTADLLALIRRGGVITQYYPGREPSKFFSPIEPTPLWIEVKAPGKKQSPEQTTFESEVTKYGCSYLLADSIDTVIDWLKARGI